MKKALMCFILLTVAATSFAEQTKTECPWMKENERNNAKTGLSKTATKPARLNNSGTGTRQ